MGKTSTPKSRKRQARKAVSARKSSSKKSRQKSKRARSASKPRKKSSKSKQRPPRKGKSPKPGRKAIKKPSAEESTKMDDPPVQNETDGEMMEDLQEPEQAAEAEPKPAEQPSAEQPSKPAESEPPTTAPAEEEPEVEAEEAAMEVEEPPADDAAEPEQEAAEATVGDAVEAEGDPGEQQEDGDGAGGDQQHEEDGDAAGGEDSEEEHSEEEKAGERSGQEEEDDEETQTQAPGLDEDTQTQAPGLDEETQTQAPGLMAEESGPTDPEIPAGKAEAAPADDDSQSEHDDDDHDRESSPFEEEFEESHKKENWLDRLKKDKEEEEIRKSNQRPNPSPKIKIGSASKKRKSSKKIVRKRKKRKNAKPKVLKLKEFDDNDPSKIQRSRKKLDTSLLKGKPQKPINYEQQTFSTMNQLKIDTKEWMLRQPIILNQVRRRGRKRKKRSGNDSSMFRSYDDLDVSRFREGVENVPVEGGPQENGGDALGDISAASSLNATFACDGTGPSGGPGRPGHQSTHLSPVREQQGSVIAEGDASGIASKPGGGAAAADALDLSSVKAVGLAKKGKVESLEPRQNPWLPVQKPKRRKRRNTICLPAGPTESQPGILGFSMMEDKDSYVALHDRSSRPEPMEDEEGKEMEPEDEEEAPTPGQAPPIEA